MILFILFLLLIFTEASHDHFRDTEVFYSIGNKKFEYSFIYDRVSKLIKGLMFFIAFIVVSIGITIGDFVVYLVMRFFMFDAMCYILKTKGDGNFIKFLKTTEYYYWYTIIKGEKNG